MLKPILIATATAFAAPAAFAGGFYANIEANSGFTGADYSSTTTDIHLGYEGGNDAFDYYIQGGPAVVATDGEVFNYLALLMAVLILVLSIAICCIEDNFVKMMLLIPLNLIVLTAVHIGKLIVEEAYSSLTAVATVLDALFICLAVMIIPLTVILFCYVVYKIIDSIFNSRKKRDDDWDSWQ